MSITAKIRTKKDAAAEGCTTAALGLILAVALWPFALGWRAYVIQALWGWFLTPLKLPIEMPSIYTLIGVMFVLQLFLPTNTLAGGADRSNAATIIALRWTMPLAFLCAGWTWHWLQWWT